jgi:hypothetical protein
MESFPSIILWTFDDNTKGGCLAALDGETFLFHPMDERDRGSIRIPVYARGFFPEPGKLAEFGIEFGDFGSREDYRVTSLASLAETDCILEDLETLTRIYFKHEVEQSQKTRGRNDDRFMPRLRTRTYGH